MNLSPANDSPRLESIYMRTARGEMICELRIYELLSAEYLEDFERVPFPIPDAVFWECFRDRKHDFSDFLMGWVFLVLGILAKSALEEATNVERNAFEGLAVTFENFGGGELLFQMYKI